MSIEDVLAEAGQKMDKAIEVAREELSSIRTGRAHPGMFAKLTADYYGTPTPLNQIASVHIPEPRQVLIAPYDKSAMGAIERALRDSDLGVNPSNDGAVIRVSLPQLTEDRRRDFVKLARSRAEDSRISVRTIRRSAKESLDRMVKDGDAGEDDIARAEKSLQAVTKKHVDSIDDMLRHKEVELLEV